VEPSRDLGSLSDADLKQLIDELTKQERILHRRIDRLRAELQARLEGRTTRGKSVQRDPGE
jgi:chaperonin cofactor prefoldin